MFYPLNYGDPDGFLDVAATLTGQACKAAPFSISFASDPHTLMVCSAAERPSFATFAVAGAFLSLRSSSVSSTRWPAPWVSRS